MMSSGIGQWCNLKRSHCSCKEYSCDQQDFICKAYHCPLLEEAKHILMRRGDIPVAEPIYE